MQLCSVKLTRSQCTEKLRHIRTNQGILLERKEWGRITEQIIRPHYISNIYEEEVELTESKEK